MIALGTLDTPVHEEMPYRRIQTLVAWGLLASMVPGLVIGLVAFRLRRG